MSNLKNRIRKLETTQKEQERQVSLVKFVDFAGNLLYWEIRWGDLVVKRIKGMPCV